MIKLVLRIVVGLMVVYGMFLSYPMLSENTDEHHLNLFSCICMILGFFAWVVIAIIVCVGTAALITRFFMYLLNNEE